MDEDKIHIPVFWKYFGSAIISFLSVLFIALFGYIFTQIYNTQNNLTAFQNNMTTFSSEVVKKTEFNERISSIWNVAKQLEPCKEKLIVIEKNIEKIEKLQNDNEFLKNKILTLEKNMEKLEQLQKEINSLRERIAALEAQKKPS